MEYHQNQRKFFEKLKEDYLGKMSLPEELAQLLDISTDSAYRRIRGEKLLHFNEINKNSQKSTLN